MYEKQKEADAILATYNAQSEGMKELMNSFGNDHDSALKYMMLDKGVYRELAKTNADAISGLKPKITVWNTNGGDNTSQPIQDVMKMLPPLLTTIHDQTGLKPGKWLVDGLDDSSNRKP